MLCTRVLVARLCEAPWYGVVVGSGSGHQSVKRHLVVGLSQAVERHAPPLCAREDVLYGSLWYMISLLLTTDADGTR